eukprot:c25784_g2_i1 orf=44-1090(+)
MEEESERRKERLRTMREEAAIATQQPSQSLASVSSSPPLCNPLDHNSDDMQTPRFAFYTDPLATFTGSRKKSFPRPPPPVGSPNWTQVSSSATRSGLPGSFESSSITPPRVEQYPSHWQPPQFSPIWQPSFPNSSPLSANTTSSGHSPGSGFGSPQASPTSHYYNMGGRFSPIGPGLLSSSCPSQRHTGSESETKQYSEERIRSYGSSPGGRGGGRWSSLNRSPGGRSSPGGFRDKDSRGVGGPGSKPFQKNHPSARDHPELFFRKSMLEDPWADLIPVRRENIPSQKRVVNAEPSTADACQSWLPRSITNKKAKGSELRVNLASGPSLAESLAASVADAISDIGETG